MTIQHAIEFARSGQTSGGDTTQTALTVLADAIEQGDCPMLVWTEDKLSGRLIGRLPDDEKTTLFIIERFSVGGFRLLGAFIPDDHENRFYLSLAAAKATAQLVMNEWVTTFTRGWK